MTAFTDILDLRTAVVEQVGRADIADVFPRLVSLAEADFNRKLRLRRMINEETVTFYDGKGALPHDYLEMIGVYAPCGFEYHEQTPQHVRRSGYYYSIERLDMVAPHLSGQLRVQYYGKIPSLVGYVDLTGLPLVGVIAPGPGAMFDMTRTNWMLEQYPELYLYGVGTEAAKYLKDGDMAQASGGLLAAAIADVRADDDRARYSRARVRVAGCTP